MKRFRTLAGLLLVAIAIGVAWQTIPRQTGSVLAELPSIDSTESVDSAVLIPVPSPGTTTPSVAVEPILESRSGSMAPSPRAAVPTRIRIPRLGVDASVLPLGVDSDGRMDVPSDVDEVGWYRHGPRPGEMGSAVLAAHIDSAGQGPGVFFRLGVLGQGDVIEIEDDEGGLSRFVVRAVAIIPKDELPLERVFARSGTSVLTLVTCGGGFSRSQRSYDSNIVVVAVPVEAPRDEGSDPR